MTEFVPWDWNVFEFLRVQVCHFKVSSSHGWRAICELTQLLSKALFTHTTCIYI